MSYTEIKNQIDTLSHEWQEFKNINERRLHEIEKKGSADALTANHLQKLNESMDKYTASINKIEAMDRRPKVHSNVNENNLEEHEYKNAFCKYLRSGHEMGLANLEQKSLSTLNDSEGGYLITPTMATKITDIINSTSVIRMHSSNIKISNNSIELLEGMNQATSGWTTEIAEREESEAPTINKRTISVHELYAQPMATQKLIDDSRIDIENWLANKIADSFASLENKAFTYGDGAGKPRGILSYPAGNSWGNIAQHNAKLDANSILLLLNSLEEKYKKNAKIMLNNASLGDLRTAKDNNGNYLWQPLSDDSLSSNFLGAEILVNPDMPDNKKGNLAVAIADFNKAYQIVDRLGITVLRDPFTSKPFVKFYATKRVGADIVDFNALKILKIN